jgi:hypothetical protein
VVRWARWQLNATLDGQVDRSELRALWQKVGDRLSAADALLPAYVRRGDEGGSIEGYRDYRDHNELELALDELEMLGEANDVPDEYWSALATAAQLMSLEEHEQRCRSRLLRSR